MLTALRGHARGPVSRILLGSLVGQGTLLAISPILARIYSPSDFAALAAFTGLSAMLGAIVTLNWERAIVIPKSRIQAELLFWLSCWTCLAVSCALVLPFYVLRSSLDRAFNTSTFEALWWLFPLTALVLGLHSTVSAWLTRNRNFNGLAFRNALQGGVQALSTVVLGLYGLIPSGLLTGAAVGRTAAIFGLTGRRVLPPIRLSLLFRPAGRSITRRTAARFRRFPMVSTWSRVLNQAGTQLPPILVVALYSNHQAGLWALTLRVLATPVGIVVDAVSQYFESTFAHLFRMRTSRLRHFIRKLSIKLLIITLLPAAVLFTWAPDLFAFAFGPEWREAGTLARIVLPTYVLQFVVSPVSRSLLVLERQRTQLVWDTARGIVSTAAVVAPVLILTSPKLENGLALYAASQGLFYVVLFAQCLKAAGQVDKAFNS